MPIGTSLGAYFPDELSFHMAPFINQGDGVDSPAPVVMKDNNEVSPQELIDKQELSDPNKPVMVSDMDDRRNQGLYDMLSSHIGEQLTMEKIQAILQHPLANVSQTLTANELPTPMWDSSLAKDLGSQDIK